jgi:hypothetical protein
MSTQTHPSIATPQPAAHSGSGQSIAVTVIGSVVAVIGIVLALGGGGLLAVFGNDGTVASNDHAYATPRAALVSDVADITDTNDVSDIVGDPKVRFAATTTNHDAGVFVGIGPADQVDRYMAGAPYDEVTDFDVDPFKLNRSPHEGTKRPAAPASQDFWVAQASGAEAATLRWKVQDGDYRMVVMNADGSRHVDTKGDVALTLPHIGSIGWSLLGGGILLAIGGLVAVTLSVRQRRND